MDSDNRYLHLIRQDCPLPPGTHVIAYCRDSGGEEQDRSIQQQTQTVREYCNKHGLVLERIYADEARTGASAEKRTQLQDMLSDIARRFKQIRSLDKRRDYLEKHPFGIIVWKSNRLGRDSIETTYIKADLRIRGISIVNLVPTVETGDAKIDALFEMVQQYQDEKLLEEISDNSRRGLAELVSLRDNDPSFRLYNPDWPTNDGRYLGIMPGLLPIGFKAEQVLIGVRERKGRKEGGEKHYVQRMVPDHNDNKWQRCYLAWKMRTEGEGIKKIMEATQLYKTISGYSGFFNNRIYTGDLEYGGKVYEGFVEPLIPKEWFQQEQRLRDERSAKLQQRKSNPMLEPRRVASRHLLSGLVYCGAVEGEEHPMNADTVPARKGKRTRWDFYICSLKKNSREQRCQASRVSAAALDRAVIDNLTRHILNIDNLRPVADALSSSLQERNADVSERIAVVQGKLDEIQRSISKLVDAVEKAGFSTSLQTRLQAREQEEREIIAELANLEDLLIQPREIPEVSDKLLGEWAHAIHEALVGEEIELARQAIQQFVAKVVVNEKTATLYYTLPLSPISRYSLTAPTGFEPVSPP